MSWYEGTPGGSWRDMGARRKIQTWIARRDFLKNETIVKMTTTMMMMTKLVIMMAIKGDIDEDNHDPDDETCLDGQVRINCETGDHDGDNDGNESW